MPKPLNQDCTTLIQFNSYQDHTTCEQWLVVMNKDGDVATIGQCVSRYKPRADEMEFCGALVQFDPFGHFVPTGGSPCYSSSSHNPFHHQIVKGTTRSPCGN